MAARLIALPLALILVSCYLLLQSAPSSEPAAADQKTLPAALPATAEASPFPAPASELSAVNEKRLLILEWPESIRVGESDLLLLTLEVDQKGMLTPTAQIAGHAVSGTPVELPNLYETHNLVFETRLDMTGPDISPQGTMSEALRPGQKVQFAWSIHPNETGKYRGMLWLYLNIAPKSGGEVDRRTLLARQVEIEAVNVLGLPAKVVRWTGILGTVTSTILGIPFLQDGLLWLWRRFEKKKIRKFD
ncbi:MAG: hypothetical protein HPY59_05560 [Anaerolineae bacterium]|nr:hypothetical protein [Anaerolineae bacterium]